MLSWSSGREHLDELSAQPVGGRMLVEELSGLVGFEKGARSAEREQKARSEQGEELESDEESAEKNEVEHEPTATNEGRRYPLRDRRVPQRFPDREYVLLNYEGEPESFEEATRDAHNYRMRWSLCMRTSRTS